ncbi:MAG: hypothetical protein CMO98_09535 [Woeseia sp.]|nr:hypothetical protein [Woeseia sp.]|tara:strand:+ start:6945 stop:7883 length:939 start_codon:yes stop_codon:yes gene_type:complete
MSLLNNRWLIADIGATTSRCAIYDGNNVQQLQIINNNGYKGAIELLDQYISQVNINADGCALAVAAPVESEEIQMINRDWRFSRQKIANLGFRQVKILNDFHAISYALPHFDDSARIEVGTANKYRSGNTAVLGPGSGLGMAAWIDGSGPMCGEGGHITLSGRNETEDIIIAVLRKYYGHCSAERILSGPGLLALHEAMHKERLMAPEDITGNMKIQANRETMDQWFKFLATVAAELALITGALGGVYIAGGIVPSVIKQIKISEFRSRFEDKNRYGGYMQGIPTWIITDPVPGLTGLTYLIDQKLNSEALN